MKFYEETIKVRGYELDSLGHVNQAQYLLYAESVRWNHFLSVGITLDKLYKEWNMGPVVLAQNIQYFKELTLGDEVRITSQLTQFEGKRGTISQDFFKGDIKAAHLEMNFTFLDFKTRRSCEPHPELLKMIQGN